MGNGQWALALRPGPNMAKADTEAEGEGISVGAGSTDAATTDSSRASGSLDATQKSSRPSFASRASVDSSGRAPSRYSRRGSGIDDTARPLAPEKERSTRQRVSGRLKCANLRFSNLGVVGREREIEALRAALGRARGRGQRSKLDEEADRDRDDDATEDAAQSVESSSNDGGDGQRRPSCGKELVLISGTSGCGKSRLASTLSASVDKGGGLFVQGKYDLYFRDEPYFGISQACGEIIGLILQLKESGDENDVQRYRMISDALREGFGDEIHLLAAAIAPIVEIVGEQSLENACDRGEVNLAQSRERFNYLFRKFIRIITATHGTPLVMVLDDLQWADVSSLELLALMLSDRESSGLMIVGCFRSEEVADSHMLSQTIVNLKEKARSQNLLHVTELPLDALSPSDVNNILMELLSIDDADKSTALAELCHRRSMGNCFHLMTFFRLLQDEQFLEFNVGAFRWEFDVEKIESKTFAASNVVEIVTSRLEQLPASLQEVLQIAACLGSSFESELLHLVWNEMREGEGSKNQLRIHLEKATKDSILECDADSMRYRWAHDNVQEAAMMLGNDYSMQFRVGLVLLAKLNGHQLDESVIFIVANLLQCGDLSGLDDGRRDEVLQVSLGAAKKAVVCSAFTSAAKYVENGVELLPKDPFTHNYDLALELFSLGAEVEGFAGNDTVLNRYCEEVFTHADVRRPLDKIRCYNAQLSRLGTTFRPKAACTLCLDILDDLGTCKIPRSSRWQKVSALSALRKIKDVDNEVLQSLPLMTDSTLLASMSILDRLSSYSNVSGNTILVILATYNMYRLTLSNGLCPQSSCGFASLAVVRCAMSNFQGGKVFADQSLSLLSRLDSKSAMSRTYFISFFIVKPWTMPFLSGLKSLQESYRIGLQCGDTESASWGIAMYLVAAYLGGTNLESIVSDIRTYLPQIKDLKRDAQVMMVTIYFQACLCFMGFSENPTEMSGEAIPNAERYEMVLQSLDSKFGLLVYQIQQSFLCAVFGEHERGTDLALERGDAFFRVSAASPQAMLDTFARGISLFDMARRTKKKRYKRAAKKTLSTMRKWAKADNPNAVNKLAILEAEQYALSGNRTKASFTYEKSITLSIRCGMLPDAALASERYGEYLLNEIKYVDKAVLFFEKAVQCYTDWGAAAKVEQMSKKYSSLWTVPHKIELKVDPKTVTQAQ